MVAKNIKDIHTYIYILQAADCSKVVPLLRFFVHILVIATVIFFIIVYHLLVVTVVFSVGNFIYIYVYPVRNKRNAF